METTFKNKRILMMCREVYSFPFYFLSQKWMNNNTVAAYFFSPSEVKYNCNFSNNNSYYAFLNKTNLKIYTSSDITDKFTSILHSEDIIDKDFLLYIESKYTHFLNLNQQVISTQSLSRHYHYRNFWHSNTYVQQLNWLILNYQKAIEILDEFKPDVVLDSDNAELGRCVMREVCYERNIPYIYLDSSRFETYRIFSFNLGLHPSDVFKDLYNKNLNDSQINLKDEFDYIQDFKEKNSIMHPMYNNDITSSYHAVSYLKICKKLIRLHINLFYQDIIKKNIFIKRTNPILFTNTLELIKYFFRVEFTRKRLSRSNKFFKTPIDGEEYVYMPLHLIPESTTFTLAPLYINELTIIEAVSKSLPAGWWLYVKEHQAMLGERTTDFYEKVNRLPNVKMVQYNYYTDPKPWIIKSKGVITISGTTAYEAALMGKKALVFADVPFSLIEGVKRVNSFRELPLLLKQFNNSVDNTKSCASYIKTVKELGEEVNMKDIIQKGSNYIINDIEPDDEFMKNINNIEKIFLKGYKYFHCNKGNNNKS